VLSIDAGPATLLSHLIANNAPVLTETVGPHIGHV
jgi:hypothetical protein